MVTYHSAPSLFRRKKVTILETNALQNCKAFLGEGKWDY